MKHYTKTRVSARGGALSPQIFHCSSARATRSFWSTLLYVGWCAFDTSARRWPASYAELLGLGGPHG